MEDGLQDEGDGWFSTASEPQGVREAEEIPSLDGPGTAAAAGKKMAAGGADQDSDDDIPDIDDLELEDEEEDEVHCYACS